jgi:hypothetical protein
MLLLIYKRAHLIKAKNHAQDTIITQLFQIIQHTFATLTLLAKKLFQYEIGNWKFSKKC